MLQLKSIVAAVAVACAATAAMAQEGATRADVIADLARAQAAGELSMVNDAWDGTTPEQTPKAGVYGRPFADAGLSRDVVRAEMTQAQPEIAQRQFTDYVGGD